MCLIDVVRSYPVRAARRKPNGSRQIDISSKCYPLDLVMTSKSIRPNFHAFERMRISIYKSEIFLLFLSFHQLLLFIVAALTEDMDLS